MRSRLPEVIVAGVLLIVAALAWSGRYSTLNVGGGAVWIVDRYTGSTRVCFANGASCKDVKPPLDFSEYGSSLPPGFQLDKPSP